MQRNLTQIMIVVLALAVSVQAAVMQAVGTIGNSGEVGAALMRVGTFPLEHCASGAALDKDFTLWLSGGDAIVRVGLDGRLIERFPLEPQGSTVDSNTFAVLDDTLYFFGRLPKGNYALFTLPMQSATNAKPLSLNLPKRKRHWIPYRLAPQPLDGQLVIVTEPKDVPDEIGVYFINPRAGAIWLAFTLEGTYPYGVAVDSQRDVIYIGGYFGLFVGGITHSNVFAITAVRADGSVVSNAFPAPCTKTPAIPSQFRGVISLAGGALWDSAWYGFLARLDLQGRGAPGRIVEWHHELDYPTQILGIREVGKHNDFRQRYDPLLIATPMPDAFYFVWWDKLEQQMRFIRRIGCLPLISSLGLSEEGWITVGTARAQLWWRWEDSADAPPRKAELHIAVTPGFFDGERFFSIAAQYRLKSSRSSPLRPAIFTCRAGGSNEARRISDSLPMKKPVGLSVQITPGNSNAKLFVTDEATREIWRTSFWIPNLQPNNEKWQPIRIEDNNLKAPTEIAALTDGQLLVADDGSILLLKEREDAYRLVWKFDRWGDAPQEKFGERLRFAVDGSWMLVSDSDRHRVIWLDWMERRIIGQFGITDKPGDDALHLNTPTFIALRGTHAVVADTGNQRVLKLTLATSF